MASQPLSVVLLAGHDERRVEEGLREWTSFLAGLGQEHEILLAVDASENRAAAWGEQHAGARVVRDAKRPGIGAALRAALAEARNPLLFYALCGLDYQPADLRQLLAEIDKVHVVSGHRVGRPVPFWLRILEMVYRGFMRVVFGLPMELLPGWLGWKSHGRNSCARILFGLRLHDVECTFRLFRREVFRRIPIQSDGSFAHIEILAKANFLGAVMTEVPVHYRFDIGLRDKETVGERRQRRTEAWSIFAYPDFGSTVLLEETAATIV
jgi:hypothetical protein